MARRSLSKDTTTVRQRLDGHAIVLVGLMGAGKTTVGRRLAEKLGLAFVDADHEIELAAGQTIPEIFARHGEAYFRDGERKVIARLLENGAQVLATGGGAYMNGDTREAIRRHGIAIWLRADFDLLMRRVRRRSNRPLLQNADPEAVMRKLIEERYPVYAEADLTVDSRDVAHTSIVNTIIRNLARWPGWDRLHNAQS
ncbi:shikimate kinase [Taklimakanibacter deserti]|uniref:shikimate kinase n=1 Tax=Taklimakanibacter deserti TaxID=2267839 RepID=UPI000E658052